MLRAAFFQHITEIVNETGPISVEEYILPLMVQALAGKPNYPFPYDSWPPNLVSNVLKRFGGICLGQGHQFLDKNYQTRVAG